MGEANSRGTFEERRNQSLERQLEQSEVIVFLKAEEGKLNISTLTRDEQPNQDSPAVIFAAFLNANFRELAGQAMALAMSHAMAETGELPHAGTVIQESAKPQILDAGGKVARSDQPLRIVGAGGETLQ